MLLSLNGLEFKLESESIEVVDNLIMIGFELSGSDLIELLQLNIDEDESCSAGWFNEIIVDSDKIYRIECDLNVEGNVTFRMINESSTHNSIFKMPLMIWDYNPDVKGILQVF